MHGGLSHFKATLQRRKERLYSKEKNAFSNKSDSISSDKDATNFDFPKMSEAEFEIFSKSLIKERKIRERRDIIITAIIVISIFLILYFL